MDTTAIIASLPAGFSLHIGQDSLTIWCPTCEDCIFENDGDRYYQNFESPLSLNAVNVAVLLHNDRHHAKPQNAPSRAAKATPAPEATTVTDSRTGAPQAPAPAHNVDHVECSHGYILQRDSCPGCDAHGELPHPYNGVDVRQAHTRKIISRCQDCGLPPHATAHRNNRLFIARAHRNN